MVAAVVLSLGIQGREWQNLQPRFGGSMTWWYNKVLYGVIDCMSDTIMIMWVPVTIMIMIMWVQDS